MTGARATVLVVEDDDFFRRVLVRVLEGAGHEVLVAPTGEEAMALVGQRPGEIRLLLTDLVMPGMSGLELARRARPLQPRMAVLCMSGYDEQTLRERGADALEFIEKPFAPRALTERVRALLASERTREETLETD
jgi:two-component system, cell cycle sensor histidine kinase and response regulator CckA